MDWPDFCDDDDDEQAALLAHRAKCETIRRSVIVYDNGLEQYARYVVFFPELHGAYSDDKARLINAGVPHTISGEYPNVRVHCFMSHCDFESYFRSYLASSRNMHFSVVPEPFSVHSKFFRGRTVNFYLFAAYLNNTEY